MRGKSHHGEISGYKMRSMVHGTVFSYVLVIVPVALLKNHTHTNTLTLKIKKIENTSSLEQTPKDPVYIKWNELFTAVPTARWDTCIFSY